jgi:hypothetical protein
LQKVFIETLPTAIASGNTVKLKQPTVIGLLEGFYLNFTQGDSLREYSKAQTTNGDRPLSGFLSQLYTR